MIDTSKMIFCFGSNTGGIHGGGAARFAYEKKKARWGASYGHYGDSFAIPTKGHKGNIVSQTLGLAYIKRYVDGFMAYACHHFDLEFQVTCIGCGLAGLKHEDIAPMFIMTTVAPDGSSFEHIPANLWFDEKWRPYLGHITDHFWGEG